MSNNGYVAKMWYLDGNDVEHRFTKIVDTPENGRQVIWELCGDVMKSWPDINENGVRVTAVVIDRNDVDFCDVYAFEFGI